MRTNQKGHGILYGIMTSFTVSIMRCFTVVELCSIPRRKEQDAMERDERGDGTNSVYESVKGDREG
jgi:hypothetical protein